MFIRGRELERAAWQETRPAGDGFVFRAREGGFEVQIAPNADRAVELFTAVLEHFGPFGQLTIDDWRSDQRWSGEALATSDVRDAVARARHTLSAHAGTELTFTADGEQATLTANLEVQVVAPTDRWLYLLQGKGLTRRAQRRPRSWELQRGEFGAVTAAQEAIALLVERLQLQGAAR